MSKQDYITLLDSMYPNFFEKETVRNMSEEWICDEMILALEEFRPEKYEKEFDDRISFGYYEGDLEELKKEVRRVVEYWAESYNGKHRIFCGYMDGKVVSFCLIED